MYMHLFPIKVKLYNITSSFLTIEMPWKLKVLIPTTQCSFLVKLLCLILRVGCFLASHHSMNAQWVRQRLTLIKGRPNISEDTSCTTLFSRGTPYRVWANCPNGIFYVQMLGKYRKADQLFLVSRRIVPVLSINCYLRLGSI